MEKKRQEAVLTERFPQREGSGAVEGGEGPSRRAAWGCALMEMLMACRQMRTLYPTRGECLASLTSVGDGQEGQTPHTQTPPAMSPI